MTLTFTNDSATIGTTEYFLFSDSTSQTPQTTDVYLSGWIDLSNMVAGDQYQITLYEKVNGGTQRAAFPSAYPTGVQSSLFVLPRVLVGEGYDIGVKKIAGTDRVVAWSLRTDNASGGSSITADDILDNECDSTAPAGANTVREILNVIVSAVTASGTDLDSDGTVTIRNTGDTKNRIVGTVSGGTRTLTTLDGTE